VIDGLEADVVTLALSWDIDAIARTGLLPATWQKRLPTTARPTPRPSSSWCARATQRIRDWEDLAGPACRSSRPTRRLRRRALELPRRLGPCAAQGGERGGRAQAGRRDLPQRAGARHGRPRLDRDLRRAGHRRRADRWENEALLTLKEFGAGKFEIVAPSSSILAEPSVALVDKVVDRRGTRKVARPTCSSSIRRPARSWRRNTSTARAIPRSQRGSPTATRSSRCSPSTSSSAAGRPRRSAFRRGGEYDRLGAARK